MPAFSICTLRRPAAARARRQLRLLASTAVLTAISGGLIGVTPASAGFGLVPGSVTATAHNSDGTVSGQAGSHPYTYDVHFQFKTDSEGHTEGGEPRDVITDLPPGLIGNPQATPRCPRRLFEGLTPQCPADTQIGVLHAVLPGAGEAGGPLYNMDPPPGSAGQLAFSVLNLNALEDASVQTESGYGLEVATFDLPKEVSSVTATIWGVPADAGHNPERGFAALAGGSPVPSDAPLQPFLTMPASCDAPLAITVKADSKHAPGVFTEESGFSLDSGNNRSPLSGCESVPFSPSVSADATSELAESASGLDFQLKLPNQGLLSPVGIAETEPRKTVVTLPQGMTVNPAAAAGLGACRPVQYRAETIDSLPGQGCPESSKLGTVVARTPLLEETLEGSVYLAAPHDNPFDSLIALYIVARAPERGVLVKQAGEVRADPVTGQLRATFDGLPPLPYSSFDLHFREGPRAPLTTPLTCGTYTTTSDLTPWSAPEGTDAFPSARFEITAGPSGHECVSSEAQEPNTPDFEAGTTTPIGGSYSPFVMRLTRENGTQRLSAINVSLPPGLTGKLAGVQECSDAQIATATARTGFGEGASEQAGPSCPQTSEIGTVTVGAGSGSPLYVGGRAYLAGPYKGAPLSLAIITPAIAGPFDLGAVVVRAALYVNPATAQVTVRSDPVPTILQGIPLDIRSIAVLINRPQFMLNPTSCEPMTVTGEAISTQNQVAALSSRFQVGACQGLRFKPSFQASTQGKTSKANGASLVVKIAAKPGEANIRKVDLQLPLQLPSRLTTLQKACTEAQFNVNPAGCPAGSVIGSATAHTPILQAPLSGPAYLVSHGGAAFPDVEFVLQADERGGDIEIVLDGGTQIKKGVTYSRFETLPDAPISSFETNLPQGPHSILTAFGSLCNPTKTVTVKEKVTVRRHGKRVKVTKIMAKQVATSLVMPTTITGQNGAVTSQSTKVAVTGCKKAKPTPKATKAKGRKSVKSHKGRRR
jgi:hypothetical protein